MRSCRSLFLVIGTILCASSVQADDRLGLADLHAGVAGLTVEEFLPPIDPANCTTTDLRCNFANQTADLGGAMYQQSSEPVPNGSLCFEGSQPCYRSEVFRHRPTVSASLLVYFDERVDSNGIDVHRGSFDTLFVDLDSCNVYLLFRSYCAENNGDCTLYTQASSVVRVKGLKRPKCDLP